MVSVGVAEGCAPVAGDCGASGAPPMPGPVLEELPEAEPGNGKRSVALGALELPPGADGFGVVPHGSGSGITEQGFGSADCFFAPEALWLCAELPAPCDCGFAAKLPGGANISKQMQAAAAARPE
jgi:hypothetical protein